MVASAGRFILVVVAALLPFFLVGCILLFQDHAEGGVPFPGSHFLFVEKGRNRLFLYEGGRPVKLYPVSKGREPELTPEGRFKVFKRIENPGDPTGLAGWGWMCPVVRTGSSTASTVQVSRKRSVGMSLRDAFA